MSSFSAGPGFFTHRRGSKGKSVKIQDAASLLRFKAELDVPHFVEDDGRIDGLRIFPHQTVKVDGHRRPIGTRRDPGFGLPGTADLGAVPCAGVVLDAHTRQLQPTAGIFDLESQGFKVGKSSV